VRGERTRARGRSVGRSRTIPSFLPSVPTLRSHWFSAAYTGSRLVPRWMERNRLGLTALHCRLSVQGMACSAHFLQMEWILRPPALALLIYQTVHCIVWQIMTRSRSS